MKKIEEALLKTTDSKAVFVGDNALTKVDGMFKELFPNQRAIIVADKTTFDIAGNQIQLFCAQAGIEQDEPFVYDDPAIYGEWKYVEQLEDRLKLTDAIPIAVGSGVINDITKLVASRVNRKYMCFGTATSMDGYTAYGSSITYQGNKQTFDCPAPYGMILDTKISSKAPEEMSASGYADLIAKIPAGADWLIADALDVEKIDDFAFNLVQDGLKDALSEPEKLRNGDIRKVEQLGDGLLLSGFAMQATKSSRPASGAEHQFSHYWDMDNLKFNGESVSHGFKVGIGTLASTAFLELLIDAPVGELDIEKCVSNWKSWEETEEDIESVFGGRVDFIARAAKETKEKYVNKEELREQLTKFKANWSQLREEIKLQVIPFSEIKNRLKLVGAPYEPEQIGVSRSKLRDTYLKIPYMRSRFTSFDIIFRCGYYDEFLNKVFGKGGVWEI